MKKFFSTLSSTLQRGVRGGLLFLALVATTALWAYDFSSGGLYYNITSDSTVSVTCEQPYDVPVSLFNGRELLSQGNYMNVEAISIPSTINYSGKRYKVTSIGESAFFACHSLKSVTIPNTIERIGDGAFAGCHVDSITIPNSVRSLGCAAFHQCHYLKSIVLSENIHFLPYAVYVDGHYESNYFGCFEGCNNLTTITIPNSVTSIAVNAFKGCNKLTTITIPNSVTSIGENAFKYCIRLASITIPDGITYVGVDAFKDTEWLNRQSGLVYVGKVLYQCDNTVSVADIKEGTIRIVEDAFSGCTKITKVVIPYSLERGGDFTNCSSLQTVIYNAKHCSDIEFGGNYFRGEKITSFKFGDRVKKIPRYLCANLYSLTSVTIPDSVTSIGEGAFLSCSGLTSITIGNSVTSIGEEAFYGCSSLTSITIPNSVTTVGGGMFFGCDKLESVVLSNNMTSLPCYSWENYIDGFFAGCSSLTSITIPNSVTNIGGYAFSGCTSLTSITIPNSVTNIGGYAFSGCTSLTSVTIGNSVTSIGNYAFDNCSALTSITWNAENCSDFTSYDYAPFYDTRSQITEFVFGDKVQHIPAYLCYEMNTLTSVTIPNSVTSIGSNAFCNCSSLTRTEYTGDIEGWCKISFGNSSANPTNSSKNLYIDGKLLTNLVIPESITNINADAFRNNDALVSITVSITSPNSVTSIGSSAFYDCDALTSVTIPNSVTSIGSSAFSSCDALTSVTIPNSVTSIGASAFSYCSSLRSITIPNSVTSIGLMAFFDCSSLTSVTIGNSVTSIGSSAFSGCSSLTSVTIPNSVTSIGTCVFQNCSSLISANIGNSVTSIEDGAFYGCSSLTSVTIPNSVTSVESSAFNDCKALNKITLPASIRSIGPNAFAGCTKLYDIYCFAMEPPTAYESSFANYNAFLHVPCDNQRVYLLDVLFGNFKYIECIEAETTPTDTVVVTPSFNDAEFIWPSNSSADSYTLAISKDGEVFCTLTFNANGQLTGIAFAPSRSGQHHIPAAAQTANGYAFTVTGLDEGSNYTYDLLIQDRSGNTLQSYSSEFRTQSTNDRTVTVEYDAAQGQVTGAGTYLVGDTVTLTATPNDGYRFVRWSNDVEDNPYTFVISEDIMLSAEFTIEQTAVENITTNENIQKIIRNGQLLILRDGKTYNVMGAEIQ